MLENAFGADIDYAQLQKIYNFCRVHQTLRVTPAMESGVADHVWSIEEMCGLLPKTPSAAKQIEKAMVIESPRTLLESHFS